DYSGEWSIEDSVRRMSKGKVCSLERFRSLKDKLKLLDEAIRLHDGNVITAVLIFMKKTLHSEILFRELKERQEALRHFIHFLKETEDQQLLMELFRYLEWTEELATWLGYTKKKAPVGFHRVVEILHKNGAPVQVLQEYIRLVEDVETRISLGTKYKCHDVVIDVNDKHLEASGQDIFRKHPRKASLLFMPLVTTLFYSCIYHYTESEGTFSSPTNLRKTFKIPEKLYILTALAARAKLRAWHDIDALFTTKTYKDLKDRQQLMVYRCKLDRGSPEEDKIDMILSNTVLLQT
ncbi:hypothetical protein AB205_0164930, partial [Aquarana catesbeiana]